MTAKVEVHRMGRVSRIVRVSKQVDRVGKLVSGKNQEL